MRNKPTLTFYAFLLICCVSIISIEKAEAQENEIYELTEDNHHSKAKIKKHKNGDRNKFYNIAHKLHTTAYIKNNTLTKIYGKGQIKKITFKDVNSFKFLNKKDQKYDKTELVTVTLKNINDLNKKFDLSNRQIATKLKYVFIVCYFKCTKKQIKKFVKVSRNSNIRIFYKIEFPS